MTEMKPSNTADLSKATRSDRAGRRLRLRRSIMSMRHEALAPDSSLEREDQHARTDLPASRLTRPSMCQEQRKADTVVSVKALERRIEDPDGPNRTSYHHLRFKTARGEHRDLTVLTTDLMTPSKVLQAFVTRFGMFPFGEDALKKEIAELQTRDVPEVLLTVLCGWKGEGAERAFVTPVRSYGPARRFNRFDPAAATSDHERKLGAVRGDLKAWQREVLAYLLMSRPGIVLLGAALAGPLLRYADLTENFVLLLAGKTSTGKSTLLRAVASFQGAAVPIHPNTTARRLSEFGGISNHGLMIIDDLSLIPPSSRRAVLHELTMGTTSGNSKSITRNRVKEYPQLYFSAIIAGSAEQSAAEITSGAGGERLAGETTRCFDLLAKGDHYFDRISASSKLTSAEVAERLNAGAARYYGSGLRRWLRWLVRHPERELRHKVRAHIGYFVNHATKKTSDPVRARAAAKFGLIYAGLMLAREADLVRLKRRTILKTVLGRFKAAMRVSQSLSSLSTGDAVAALRGALVQPDAVLKGFQGKRLWKEAEARNPNWLGVKISHGDKATIGLRQKQLELKLGKAVVRSAFAALSQQRVLVAPIGEARWLCRLPSKRKVRLAELDPAWLDKA